MVTFAALETVNEEAQIMGKITDITSTENKELHKGEFNHNAR